MSCSTQTIDFGGSRVRVDFEDVNDTQLRFTLLVWDEGKMDWVTLETSAANDLRRLAGSCMLAANFAERNFGE